jgi:hypothetical protein
MRFENLEICSDVFLAQYWFVEAFKNYDKEADTKTCDETTIGKKWSLLVVWDR